MSNDRVFLWAVLLVAFVAPTLSFQMSRHARMPQMQQHIHMSEDDIGPARAMKPNKEVNKKNEDTKTKLVNNQKKEEGEGIFESMFGFLKSGEEDYYIYEDDPTSGTKTSSP